MPADMIENALQAKAVDTTPDFLEGHLKKKARHLQRRLDEATSQEEITSIMNEPGNDALVKRINKEYSDE